MPLYPKRKGIFPPAQVDPASIITQMLRNGSIATVKIEDLAVTTAKIDNLAVTNAKIDNLAVTTAKIDNLAVTTAKIENLAVTDAKIENLSVSKLTTGNLTCIGTITTGALQTGASGTNRIRIDSTYIAGYNSANVLQFYLSAADGKAYAGAGAVILDSSGIIITGQYLQFRAGTDMNNFIWASEGSGLYIQAGTADLHLSPLSGVIVVHQNIIPLSDGGYSLGSSDKRMLAIRSKKGFFDLRMKIPVGTDLYD